MQACKNLKNGKSCGMDGILNEMIKYGQHALLPCLEKLFNIILSSGTYPKIWGEGYLITIFKSGSPSDPNNYRGITINSCLSKLFNSILISFKIPSIPHDLPFLRFLHACIIFL
jgi:hypothetical protein